MPTKTKPRRGGRKPLPPGQRLVKDSVTLSQAQIDYLNGLLAANPSLQSRSGAVRSVINARMQKDSENNSEKVGNIA